MQQDSTTLAPRPLRADARRNRQRLITAAVAALAEAGPDVPLEDIAARAGVGIATLYRNFPDRRALLLAVYSEGIDALVTLGDDLLGDGDDAFATFRRFVEANLDFSRTHRALAASVFIDTLAAEDPTATSPCHLVRQRGEALLDRVKAEQTARGDVEIDDVLRLVAGIALATDGCAAIGTDERNRLLDIVLAGIRPTSD